MPTIDYLLLFFENEMLEVFSGTTSGVAWSIILWLRYWPNY